MDNSNKRNNQGVPNLTKPKDPKKFKETKRGIPTTTQRLHERKAKTIINRFNQKSLSLPRIDDKKRLAGYPGITGISRLMAKFTPSCKYYVEPFAGTAKVFQELLKIEPLKFQVAVLNDTSDFIYNWLKENFSLPLITKLDFTEIFKTYNIPKSHFNIDQPWNRTFYEQSFSSFNRISVAEYDNEVLREVEKLQDCTFMITTRKENTRMLNSGYNNYLIPSEYVVSGKYPKVLVTTNLELEAFQKVKAEDIL